MLKRLCFVMICLLLIMPAIAEEAEIPTLPGTFVLKDLPEDMTFTVYTGPGKDYYVANSGKAKVSTNDIIRSYGRVDDEWLMVSYEISDGKNRIGYINLAEQLGDVPNCRLLDFAAQKIQVKRAPITDDPYGYQVAIGGVNGNVTVLAQTLTGGWVYVEGTLDTGEWARGFVQQSDLYSAELALEMPQRADVYNYVKLTDKYELNLPDDALAEGMTVYPLSDGSYLIAYHCAGSDRLWMRVISETGKKLFAKSVPELYLSQITLTADGFICQTFDNSEIDSGMQYTYTCKGKKWSSKKISWIEEADRFYSDNTENFTLRCYPFGEGSVIPMEIECRGTGAVVRQQMTVGRQMILCEYEDAEGKDYLLVHTTDETGAMTVRMYDTDGNLVNSVASPVSRHIASKVAYSDAVYFFSGYGTEWFLWRMDMITFTFDSEPLTITVPTECILTVIAPTTPYQLVLMDTEFTSTLCDVTPQGKMLRVMSLNGKAVWVSATEEGFLLLLQDEDGDFVLQHYAVTLE